MVMTVVLEKLSSRHLPPHTAVHVLTDNTRLWVHVPHEARLRMLLCVLLPMPVSVEPHAHVHAPTVHHSTAVHMRVECLTDAHVHGVRRRGYSPVGLRGLKTGLRYCLHEPTLSFLPRLPCFLDGGR